MTSKVAIADGMSRTSCSRALRASLFCCRVLFFQLILLLPLPAQSADIAGSHSTPDTPDTPAAVETTWGGHIRAIGTASFPDDESIYQFASTDTFYDGQAEMRLKNQLFIGSDWSVQTHYELVAQQGDTLKQSNALRQSLPTAALDQLVGPATVDDDRRLLNLTRILADGHDHVIYHRLDRLNLTHTSPLATVRLGRQALTWGNGLLFNPMDLFNPFAPTTIQRDYKMGEDMAHALLPVGSGELELLYVPRRDPDSGALEDDQTSYAAKWHMAPGTLEVDLMAARHFSDHIVAMGASGYLGQAAWRIDGVYTFLEEDTGQEDFWQLVANFDYAWRWGAKNIYGLIEFYYNGLGLTENYAQALTREPLVERLDRGDLFTLGRTYLGGQLRIELHPLVQASGTVIVNLTDPSGIVQPQLLWDLATDVQLIAGASWHWGADETEFGGFDTNLAGQSVIIAPMDQVYLWLTFHF